MKVRTYKKLHNSRKGGWNGSFTTLPDHLEIQWASVDAEDWESTRGIVFGPHSLSDIALRLKDAGMCEPVKVYFGEVTYRFRVAPKDPLIAAMVVAEFEAKVLSYLK